jgi:aerobic carbon-monoxide dehydrogenase large subunit
VRAEQFPYPTRTGLRYDTGDYQRALEVALERADYDGLRAEQRRRRAAGDPVQLGIGVSLYVAITGGRARASSARSPCTRMGRRRSRPARPRTVRGTPPPSR